MSRVRAPITAVVALAAMSVAAAQATAPAVRVRCVDTNGKVIAGAEVHVFQQRWLPDDSLEIVAAGPLRSGDDGLVETPATDDAWKQRWIYGRVPGVLVGAQSTGDWWLPGVPVDTRRTGNLFGPPEPKVLDLVLEPSRSLRGRVVVPAGTRPETVTVGVAGMWGRHFPSTQYPRGMRPGLERVLPERFDCSVGADGTFVLHEMPEAPTLCLEARGPGVASTRWTNEEAEDPQLPEVVAIELASESTFGGTLTAPDGVPAAQSVVTLHRLSHSAMPQTFEARTNDDGRFAVVGLPQGSFDLMVTSPGGVLRPRPIEIGRGERRKNETLQLEKAIEVSGSVVEVGGSTGVADVRIRAAAHYRAFPRPSVGRTRTDAQGRFSLRLPSGPTTLVFVAPHPGFAPGPAIDIDVAPDDPQLRQLRIELPFTR